MSVIPAAVQWQGEHNNLFCDSEGMKALLLLLAPEFSDSSGSAEQEGMDEAPKGSHTRGCVCLVPASLLSSCYLQLQGYAVQLAF